LNVELNFMIQN